MKPSSEVEAALERYESALDEAWRVLVDAADFLRDPALAGELHAFDVMPNVRAVMESLAGKKRLERIEKALGDSVQLRAALEAAPDPEEVALMRAVCEAWRQVTVARVDLACAELDNDLAAIGQAAAAVAIAERNHDNAYVNLVRWKELTEHE